MLAVMHVGSGMTRAIGAQRGAASGRSVMRLVFDSSRRYQEAS